MAMVKLPIGLKTSLDANSLFESGLYMFLTSIGLLRYVMIVGRMVILVRHALDVDWSSRLGLYIFSTIIESLVTSPESVPNTGLLFI